MTWLIPSILATLVGTALLTAVYGYLRRVYGESFLGWWAASWAAYALRLVAMLGLAAEFGPRGPLLFVNQSCALLSGLFLLIGTLLFARRPVARLWSGFTAAGIGYVALGLALDLPFVWLSIPIFAFQGLVYLWTGVLLCRTPALPQRTARVAGTALVLWGLHKFNYPFLRPVEWFAPWGYLLASCLAFTTALAILLTYFERVRAQAQASETRYRLGQERYRELVEHLGAGVAVLSAAADGAFAVREVNRAGRDIAERSGGDPLAVGELFPDPLGPRVTDLAGAALETGRTAALEPTACDCPGGSRWIEGHVFPLSTAEVVVVFEDVTARVAGQQALLEYKEFLDHADDMVAVVDEDYACRMASRAFRERSPATQCEPGAQLRDSIGGELFTETVRPRLERSFGGATVTFDLSWEEGGRGRRELAATAFPIFEEDGIKRVALVLRDITEVRAAERRVLFQTQLLQAVEQAVIATDAAGRISYWNPYAERLYGWQAAEVFGKDVREVTVPEESREQAQQILEAVLQRASWSGEFVVQDRSGRRFPAQVTNSPVYDQGGSWVGVVGVSQDISERRRAQERLEDRERELLEVQRLSHVASFEWDLERGAVSWTPEFYRLVGREPEAVPDDGEGLLALVAPQDRGAVRRAVERALAGEASPYVECQLLVPGGDNRHVVAHGRIERSSEGSPRRMVGYLQDVTERTLAEQEHRRMEEQIRHSQKMEAIGTLAGGIAHDFNNILSSILGYTELLLMRSDCQGEAREDLQEVLQAGLRARELVKQILTFSRKQEGQRQAVRPHLVVGEALRLLRQALPATVEIESGIDKRTDTVEADPTQLHQVVMNLCTNAYQALGDAGGRLRVVLEPLTVDRRLAARVANLQEGRYAHLAVEDDGCGMDPVTLSRVFEPFFTTKEQGKGTGMGMAIVHGIVHRHGGALEVTSEVGRGTRVDVYLPASTGEEQVSAPRGETPRGGGERILVVDDEPAIARVTERTLADLGYRVQTATDGRTALERFRAAPEAIDLVVTDQTMPGLTGAGLIQALLKVRPELPIIVCTGFSESLDEETAKSLGAREFLTKPLERSVLASAVRRALEARPGNGID